MFPGGWPGAGLLVLRLAAAIPLIIGGALAVRDAPQLGLHAIYFATIGVGILLLAGLWTPVAGAIVALSEIGIVLTGTTHPQSTILLASQGIALAFLGPGSVSIDARLFGRKRLNIRVPTC